MQPLRTFKKRASPVPLHLRNAPTALMKAEGHGADYRYAHDYDNAFVPGERYLPGTLMSRRYYAPSDRGLEQRLAKKLVYLDEQNAARVPGNGARKRKRARSSAPLLYHSARYQLIGPRRPHA